MGFRQIIKGFPALAIASLLHTPSIDAQSWKLTSAPIANWQAVASSADGQTLVAAIKGGGIFTSTNSGATWLSNNLATAAWQSVSSSTNGNLLIAVVQGGRIFTSTSSGKTWRQTAAPSNNWSSVVSSGSGSRLMATANPGRIYVSSNSGTNWTLTTAPFTNWMSISLSADGRKAVAGCGGLIPSPFGASWTGSIYTSADSGTTWIRRSVPGEIWSSVASSSDGSRMVAAGLPVFLGQPGSSELYISTNAGVTWNPGNFGTVPYQPITSISSSADGNALNVSYNFDSGSIFGPGGAIYTSINAGASWVASAAPNQPWKVIASSADASRLIAAVDGGGIYTWQFRPTLAIARSGAAAAISWPSSPYVRDFVLQLSSDPIASNGWTDMNAAVVDDGTNRSVTLPFINQRAFFRLKK